MSRISSGLRCSTVAERFVVRESRGYPMIFGAESRTRREATEVLVLDSAYCYRVVWSSWTTGMPRMRQKYGKGVSGDTIRKGWRKDLATARLWGLPRARAYADELAAHLNAEDGLS